MSALTGTFSVIRSQTVTPASCPSTSPNVTTARISCQMTFKAPTESVYCKASDVVKLLHIFHDHIERKNIENVYWKPQCWQCFVGFCWLIAGSRHTVCRRRTPTPPPGIKSWPQSGTRTPSTARITTPSGVTKEPLGRCTTRWTPNSPSLFQMWVAEVGWTTVTFFVLSSVAPPTNICCLFKSWFFSPRLSSFKTGCCRPSLFLFALSA